jgi:uncharacterized protein (DUF58 family)
MLAFPPSQLEFVANQLVEGFLIGLNKSPFHGFSVEFAEHRSYNMGDSLKHIDWKVYGKTEQLFTRKYDQETNLRCCLLIDTSASMDFKADHGAMSKKQFACLLSGSILHILKKQLDAAALAYQQTSDAVLSPCKSSASHYNYLFATLTDLYEGGSIPFAVNLTQQLNELVERMHKRSLIIVFSDCLEEVGQQSAFLEALCQLKFKGHEVLLFQLLESEKELSFKFEHKPTAFEDLENGSVLYADVPQVKEAYRVGIQDFVSTIRTTCLEARIAYELIDLQTPVQEVLQQFLLKRQKMQ